MEDDALLEIIPYMTKNRTFLDYVREIRIATGIDLRDSIIDRAVSNKPVNFYDLGCGLGYVSKDFYSMLEERAIQKGIPLTTLEQVYYYGIDYFLSQNDDDDERVNFLSPLDIRSFADNLPPIDIGVSFFVLPYLDKKLEAIATCYNALAQRGELFFTHYYTHQIKQVPRGYSRTAWKSSPVFPVSNLFNGCVDHKCTHEIEKSPGIIKVTCSDPLLHILNSEDEMHLPEYLGSELEPTFWVKGTPKGAHAGQLVSFYASE